MKKSILPILLTLGMFPLASHAVCTQSGHVERVTAWNDGVGTYHYIYLRNSALTNYYWYARTTDDEMAEIATSALTGTTRVTVSGDAATCPPAGGGRFMGNLRYLIVNP
ncbi:MAG: hypothetical protein KZQ95_03955 [Candidatus Thiodiazotropha sp. (ex Epidulcina cf. delphinae)]|nr:hypothetical protein [Candidatus Thiodiazotropha sp. (ex Epidulcina cf. delphinae)]